MTVALDLVSVSAGYGDNPIVREFSATLETGTITTLIGGNGAGKSTLLRAIYGTNRFFSGQIVFKGETSERLPPWERLKRGVGFVPQGRCNFPAMSVEENLKMGCYTLAGGRHDAGDGRGRDAGGGMIGSLGARLSRAAHAAWQAKERAALQSRAPGA